MTEVDLKEPQRLPDSPDRRHARQWKVFRALLVLLTFYSVLHKLVIPVFLLATPLATSPYAKIDYWFVHALLFMGFFLHFGLAHSLVPLLAGIGIAHGCWECYEVWSGHYAGWLTVSRLLSSIPIAVLSAYVMTRTSGIKPFALAWLGVLLVATLVFFQRTGVNRPAVTATAPPPPIETAPSEPTKPPACGATEIETAPDIQNPAAITLSDCGFAPTTITLTTDYFTITNRLGRPVNVHLIIPGKTTNHTVWNLLVPAGKEIRTRRTRLGDKGIGLLYSDALPAGGIVGLQTPGNRRWKLKRNPPSFEELP